MAWKTLPAACGKGHPFTEENTQIITRVRNGKREQTRKCKQCEREAKQRRAQAKWDKTCKQCGVSIPWTGTLGTKSYCGDCVWDDSDLYRIRHYGLDRFQFNAMYFEQDGICAICLEEEATDVDHNHTTGEVRALLCHNCNVAIGHLKEDTLRMARAIVYIEEYNG